MRTFIIWFVLCSPCFGLTWPDGPLPGYPDWRNGTGAIAEYEPTTGEIRVEARGISSYAILSMGRNLTGTDPANFPSFFEGLWTDDNYQIGEGAFGGGFTGGTPGVLHLGPVAETFLPSSDLILTWGGDGIGGRTEITYLHTPEPATWILCFLGVTFIMAWRFGRVMHEDGRGLGD